MGYNQVHVAKKSATPSVRMILNQQPATSQAILEAIATQQVEWNNNDSFVQSYQ